VNKILLALLFISQFSLVTLQESFGQNPLVKQWDYRYGGTASDDITCFQQTADGGFILGGMSRSGISGDKTQSTWGLPGSDYDYWVVKLDSLGIMQWDKDFGGTNNDLLYSLCQTTDGGYILGGSSWSDSSGDKSHKNWDSTLTLPDYWIIKIDSFGNKQWDKTFGGTEWDELFSLQQTTDGGYILGGISNDLISGDKTQTNWDSTTYSWDYWIVKTDSLGNKEWDRDFGGTKNDVLFSMRQTADEGYILGGTSWSGISGDKTQQTWGDSTDYDFWIVKVDSLGIKQWDKDFGGTNGDQLFSLQQTADAGYILSGQSISDSTGDKTQPTWGFIDYWIVKTDSLGNKQWDKDFGGTDWEDEFGNVSLALDGGYIIAGTSYSNIGGDKTENNLFGNEQAWIVKTDASGIKQWDKTVFAYGHDEMGLAIQTQDGCYLFAVMESGGVGGYKTQPAWNYSNDYWIVKFCDTTSLSAVNFLASDTTLCEKFCIDFHDSSQNNPTAWQWIFPGGDPSSSTDQNPTNICYNSPGNYDVTLITTNANGSDTLMLHNYITVYPTPPFPTITQVGYTLTSTPANSYQWQFNSVDIPGATNQSYTILQSGYYTVVVGDSNSCKNSTTVYVLITGVDEVNGDVNLSIYPNPSSGNFIVEWINSLMVGEVAIDVVNTLGQKVFSFKQSRSIGTTFGYKKEIDLSKEASGVYFIQIRMENIFAAKKIIITK